MCQFWPCPQEILTASACPVGTLSLPLEWARGSQLEDKRLWGEPSYPAQVIPNHPTARGPQTHEWGQAWSQSWWHLVGMSRPCQDQKAGQLTSKLKSSNTCLLFATILGVGRMVVMQQQLTDTVPPPLLLSCTLRKQIDINLSLPSFWKPIFSGANGKDPLNLKTSAEYVQILIDLL